MKRSNVYPFLLLVPLLALAGCEAAKPKPTADVLHFVDQEPNTEPTRTRMVVTDAFLRIDDGGTGESFVLFARKEGVIYNVAAADRMVLVIERKPVAAAPPIKLEHRVVREKDRPPAIGGHEVSRYRLMTNGQTCYDIFAADGLLPRSTAALREFISILATDQAVMVPVTPKEILTPCFLANNVYAAERYLAHGFPIRRVDMDKRASELVDYRSGIEVDAALFELPESYRRVSIRDMRGR